MTVFAMNRSSGDNLAPAACRTAHKSAEKPAKVIIRPDNVYKKTTPLISMVCPALTVAGWCGRDASKDEVTLRHYKAKPISVSYQPWALTHWGRAVVSKGI